MWLLYWALLASVRVYATLDSTYVAAVYEHRVILNPSPHIPLSRRDALRHMRQNLAVYEEQAALAAEQGAQILVFPEDGIHGFNFTRGSISAYLETVPDPREEMWNPCTEPGRFNNTEIQQQLSCLARRHKLYVVANMAGVQPCPPKTQPTSPCPADGRWQFNTNVVFGSDGLLVARYHKHNLYFEDAFDKPARGETVTFDTPFAGRFGLITCFDILFYEPKINLLEMGIRQIIFPTAWMNQLPLLDTIQFQTAFSLGAGVTLLAANIRSDQLAMTGSGIYSPSAAATYHHARGGDPEEGRLLVARIPVLGPVTGTLAHGGYSLRDGCPPSPPPPPPSSTSAFTATMMHDPFRFTLLNGSQGEAEVCDGDLCCRLTFRRFPGNDELYALGAFAGLHIVNGRYAVQLLLWSSGKDIGSESEMGTGSNQDCCCGPVGKDIGSEPEVGTSSNQVCAVVRCAGSQATSCGQIVEEAETKFHLVLEGAFKTPHVYPSVLASGYTLERPRRVEQSDGRVTMEHSHMAAGLVTAYLYGRAYHLDDQ